MVNKNYSLIIAFLAAVFVASSCSGNRKKTEKAELKIEASVV